MNVLEKVGLAPYTTLRAGGAARQFIIARNSQELADAAIWAQERGMSLCVFGAGSNVLPADQGVDALVVVNQARRLEMNTSTGEAELESGLPLQELFLKCAQARLEGLEGAVGIPGTVGGALVSNAGAYRSSVSKFLTEIEIAFEGRRQWVSPDWMEFSYRDSKLRRPHSPSCAILKLRMKFYSGDPKAIYNAAKEYQRQRIGKQPAPASAGSFFKNVIDFQLAQKIDGLSEGMRENGVVPAGFLIEGVGLKGAKLGGAMFSRRHANFVLNTGGATASEIFELATRAKTLVLEKYGVEIEEEVLYLGSWPHLSGE